MNNIDFQKVIMEFGDDSFVEFLARTSDYYSCYYVRPEDFSRELALEKLGQYLEKTELRLKLHDGEIAEEYGRFLYDKMSKKVSIARKNMKPSKAELYLEREKEICGELQTCGEEEMVQYMEDITKIFLTIYGTWITQDKEPVTKVRFSVNAADIDSIISNLDEEMSEVARLTQDMGKTVERILPDEIQKPKKQFQAGLGFIKDKLAEYSKDRFTEPVHDVIEQDRGNPVYTKYGLIKYLLIMFYLRLSDNEG